MKYAHKRMSCITHSQNQHSGRKRSRQETPTVKVQKQTQFRHNMFSGNKTPTYITRRRQRVSQCLIARSIKEFGVIYRLPRYDACRQATLTDEYVANLTQKYRVGKPRIHWTLITMQRAWRMHDMHARLKRRENTPIEFDRNCGEHQQILEAAAF